MFFPFQSFAAGVSGRIRTVTTFTDDRQVPILNADLNRLAANIIDDKFINVAVCAICSSATITFNNAQSDTGYGIFVQTSWASTGTAVTQKSSTGCYITVTPPGGSGGTLDAILVR